jgi:hypothetical protein
VLTALLYDERVFKAPYEVEKYFEYESDCNFSNDNMKSDHTRWKLMPNTDY